MADISLTKDLISKANAYVDSGAAITTIVAEGQIDGQQCERLSEVPGVTAAGAMRSMHNIQFLALPGSPIPAKEVTTGFPQLLDASPAEPRSGIYISQEVAEVFGVTDAAIQAETRIDTAQGPASVAGIYNYPADGRRPGLGYALLIPAPAKSAFDECWVASWPQSADIRTHIRLSLIPNGLGSTAEEPLVTQLNTRNGVSFRGSEQFDERITRLGGLAGLLGGAILGYVFVRIRRVELSAARHCGVTFTDQLAQIAIECTVASIASVVFCLPAIFYASATSIETYNFAILPLGVKPLLITGIAFITSACIGVIGVKENHLFKYFKDR